MADKHVVLAALNKLKVPHLTTAFSYAAYRDSKHWSRRSWIYEWEIKCIVAVAQLLGGIGISASERKAILEIGKYDKISNKAKTYLEGLQKSWSRSDAVAAKAKPQGTTVSLVHAGKYSGKSLGTGRLHGQCATGVQLVFIDAKKPLGLVKTWKEGIKVKGNKIKPGTAIASFRNGRYASDHAAIFIRETKTGLDVWDQWKGKAWGKRTLRFDYNGHHPYSNDGDLFSVVITKWIHARSR